MATEKYVSPKLDLKAFHCPFCGVFANQVWDYMRWWNTGAQVGGWKASACAHCNKFSMWRGDMMMFPDGGNAPLAHPDLPEIIKPDYEEARTIVARSPRGAAALLRLCIQKLCQHLGKPGKNIDSDIAALVKDGLPTAVQRALDTVRVTGNESVHPGELDLRDNPEMAEKLFGLVNFIVEKMITEPKEIEALYGELPSKKREAIEARDKK